MGLGKTEYACLNLPEEGCDEEAFVAAVMRWHFSPETGAEFWLRLAQEFDFDPRRDVKTFKDLKKFPDVSAKLRMARAETLIPRGVKHGQPRVFESGGMTGKPKFIVIYEEWLEELAKFLLAGLHLPRGNFLAAVPSGPHVIGRVTYKISDFIGGLNFTIDMDPRWVRACMRAGRNAEAERYAEHLIEQMSAVAVAQEIKYMMITPPLLRDMVKNEAVLDKLRPHLSLVILGGAEVNLDETQLIAETLLPDCRFLSHYGSTSALSAARSALINAETEHIIYEGFGPFTRYNIVNPKTLSDCAEGERGRVAVSHLTPYAFYPQVFERDTAVKLAAPDKMGGSRIADVQPDKISEGKELIEGVY